MGARDRKFYPLLKLTNNYTGECWEGRGRREILDAAGLSRKTQTSQLHSSKKWTLEEIGPPEEWDQQSYRQELYKNNKDRYKIYEAKKLAADPLYEKRKQTRLRKWKNIDGSQFTAEQHEKMLMQPCEVCGGEGDVVVDHCHDTNIVRGTLCRKCNLALGHANDDVVLLTKLMYYLQNHNFLIESNNEQNNDK